MNLSRLIMSDHGLTVATTVYAIAKRIRLPSFCSGLEKVSGFRGLSQTV
jgi:hypothetical protein